MNERHGTDSGENVLVLMKAMAILNRLSALGECELHEISDSLAISKTTCHRILATLVAGGFVAQQSRGRYSLGVTALALSPSKSSAAVKFLESSRPALKALRADTGENAYLFAIRGSRAYCVDAVPGRCASRMTVHAGGSLALHVGAAPRALLAGLTDQQIWHYIENVVVQSGKSGPSAAHVFADVAKTRECGVVVSEGDVDQASVAIGAPIIDRGGRTIGAISIGTLTAIAPPTRVAALVEPVRRAAREASALA